MGKPTETDLVVTTPDNGMAPGPIPTVDYCGHADLRVRIALTEQSLEEEAGHELRRASLAGREGVLAAIDLLELPLLRSRSGGASDQVVARAFDELFSRDGNVLESHSARSKGGFWLLMPETGMAAAEQRLTQLAQRVGSSYLEINGDRVKVTPVVGYSAFRYVTSTGELFDQATAALHDARSRLDLIPARYAAASQKTLRVRREGLSILERLWAPLHIGFSLAVTLTVPFMVYVLCNLAGFDLTRVTYPAVAVALVAAAVIISIGSFRTTLQMVPPVAAGPAPTATAIISAELPEDAPTIFDSVVDLLAHDYSGQLQVILAYNSSGRLPIEDTFAELASRDPRLFLLKVEPEFTKVQKLNSALAYVRGDFVGLFDADRHPGVGNFLQAWRWLSNGYDVVQGRSVVRNGADSWAARLEAVDDGVIATHTRVNGSPLLQDTDSYWRLDALRKIAMLPGGFDSSAGELNDGVRAVVDPSLMTNKLGPTTLQELWREHLRVSNAQRRAHGHLLSTVGPWVPMQVIPICGFVVWRHHGFGHLGSLIPLVAALALLALSAGVVRTIPSYNARNRRTQERRSWFVTYGIHSTTWFGEFKNLATRVGQLRELLGERDLPSGLTSVPTNLRVELENTGGRELLREHVGR